MMSKMKITWQQGAAAAAAAAAEGRDAQNYTSAHFNQMTFTDIVTSFSRHCNTKVWRAQINQCLLQAEMLKYKS